MPYPFPNIEREVYSKTFLKDVELTFEFDDVNPEGIVMDQIILFYLKEFHIPIETDKVVDNVVNIHSNDGLISFDFDFKHIRLKIKFPAYKSFEFVRTWFDTIAKYLDILGVTSIRRVVICKFNELQYRLPSLNSNVGNAMKEIFSPDLLHYGYDLGKSFDDLASQFSELARWEKRVSFQDDRSSSILTIEYGFSERDNQKGNGVLTMKTFIESTEAIDKDSLFMRVEEMNKALYQAFSWSVSENIKLSMRSK